MGNSIAPLHELRDNAKFDADALGSYSKYDVDLTSRLFKDPPLTIYKQQKINRSDVIGTVTSVEDDIRGLKVTYKLHDYFTEEIKKAMVDTADLNNLFPDMFGMKGPKWGDPRTSTSTNKENIVTVKLKTPSETIERKDLTVALELMDTRDRDHLLNAIALVQELGDDETLRRARNHSDDGVSFVDSYLRVPGTKIAGVCTDVKGGEYSDDPIQFVIDGKLEKLRADTYIIVKLSGPEPIGNDTLALVRG